MWQQDKYALAEAVRAVLKQGLSLKDLAEYIGVSPKAVQNYLNRKHLMSRPETREKFGELLFQYNIKLGAPATEPNSFVSDEELEKPEKPEKPSGESNWFEALQKAAGLSDADMAKAVEVRPLTWLMWRMQKQKPLRPKNIQALSALAKKLGCPPLDNSLVGRDLNKPTPTTKRTLAVATEFRQQQALMTMELAVTMAAAAHGWAPTDFKKILTTLLMLLDGGVTIEELTLFVKKDV